MACKKCQREHEPVSLAEWLWQLRDFKPKPPPGQLAVLCMVLARLDAKTGCGWVSGEQTMTDTGLEAPDTVQRALKWARDNFLIRRVTRGHRTGDGTALASQWQLLRQVQHRNDAALTQPQDRSGAVLAQPQSRERPASKPLTPDVKAAQERPQERPSQERPNTSLLPPSAVDDETRVIQLAKKHLGADITAEQARDLIEQMAAGKDTPVAYLATCMRDTPDNCRRIIAGDFVPGGLAGAPYNRRREYAPFESGTEFAPYDGY